MNETRKRRTGILISLALIFFLPTIVYLVIFPGRQFTMALTLASGIGLARMQAQVDRLEAMAVKGATFSVADKRYLRDLYSCFAKGGRLTIVIRQTGAILGHYLSSKGTPYRTKPRIFIKASSLQKHMADLRNKALDDLKKTSKVKTEYVSQRFYMPDRKILDSWFGLYYGRLILHPVVRQDGRIVLHWRAEVPWEWPTYESQVKANGDPHAKYSWIPNVQSLLKGRMRGLRIDDGLGEYLVRLGLAKPFLLYSEWTDELNGGELGAVGDSD
jgi:hypothetical protein